jgi:hypothetical protein
MSANMAFEMMATYPPSLAATKKVNKPLPEGFVWFSFAWLGNPPERPDVMKVEGGLTRIAKTGKNKGMPILVRGEGKKTVHITAEEIESAAQGQTKGEQV